MTVPGAFQSVDGFVAHPLIRRNALQFREYQVKVAEGCLLSNTLVTMPTGLGKTVVALLVTAERLRANPDSWCAVLAPTRPLINQHHQVFESKLLLPEEAFSLWTGEIPFERRNAPTHGVLFATPQTFRNEVVKGLDLTNLVLIVFDEAHRAIGNYPYVFLAQRYNQVAMKPLILALTASPASNESKLTEMSNRLLIQRYEIRTDEAWDVKPYVKKIEFKLLPVPLPDIVIEARSLIVKEISERLKSARSLNLISNANPSFREISEAMKTARLTINRSNHEPSYIDALVDLAVTRRLKMAVERLDLGGPGLLLRFFTSLAEKSHRTGAAKSLKVIFRSRSINDAIELVKMYTVNSSYDPKQDELVRVLKDERGKGVERIIVFVSYREVAKKLVEFLEKRGEGNLRPYLLIGHAAKGMSSAQQINVIDNFKDGMYNVLVTTQVGEEGLDISGSDVVVFYDNTPSAVRFIQRSGRTGRVSPGKAYIMFYKGTLDERYFWIAHRRELRMKDIISSLSKRTDSSQKPDDAISLRAYMDGGKRTPGKTIIIVDNREQGTEVVEELAKMEVDMIFSQLAIGDYILSDRVAVERKTAKDFATSLMDGRLFAQAKSLKDQYPTPFMIVEGEDLYGNPSITDNAIIGALSSLVVDFGLPVLQARDAEETSKILHLVANREQSKENRVPRVRDGRKPSSLYDMQVYLLSGLPFVERLTAERFLARFKTPLAVFNATIGDLQQVDGIGEKKARSIKDVIDKEDKRVETDSTNAPR